MRELSGAWMRHSGDFWGGFASMLVALPASVAFGVTVYAAIDPHYAAFGALAGVLGAMALGLIAPTFSLPAMSSVSETIVTMTGISSTCFSPVIVSFGVGALTTTPKAP